MKSTHPRPTAADQALLDDVVGYLNFSSGASDPGFLGHLNEVFRSIERQVPGDQLIEVLAGWLTAAIDRLQQAGGAFADATQARAVTALITDKLLQAYCEFHRDLLHHQPPAALWRPYFIGRAAEAVLAQGPSWNETERIIDGALQQLNDYVGYRPAAMLASGARSEPYPHEFVRPIPLFIKDAGVATGRYEELLTKALDILRDTSPDVLSRAWFDFNRLEELALDPRAYDFDHPVNRRPNYHFGQWDPHQISQDGYYERFVLQQVTLDALLARCECSAASPAGEDRIGEAAAVLAGTILMASGTSGDGPTRHDSNVTLSTLLPHIAAYRDDFYLELLAKLEGSEGDRLREEAQRSRQPFGAARQHLNHELARRRANQLQRVHLALLFARMGRTEAALKQADSVRVASARVLTAIYCRLTSGHDAPGPRRARSGRRGPRTGRGLAAPGHRMRRARRSVEHRRLRGQFQLVSGAGEYRSRLAGRRAHRTGRTDSRFGRPGLE